MYDSINYTLKGVECTVFFVLNGLINGEPGIKAMTVGSDILKDGFYYLMDGQADPDEGPFEDWDELERAIDAAREHALVKRGIQKMNSAISDLFYGRGLTHEEIEAAVKEHLEVLPRPE